MEKIILSGNCNWCTEAMYQRIKGVSVVTPGSYSITIAELARGPTDKVEALLVEFNPEEVKLEDLLDVFFISHNPTLVSWGAAACLYPLNRSSIIVESEDFIARSEARLKLEALKYDAPIETKIIQMEVIQAQTLLPKESFSQSVHFKASPEKEKNYYKNNPNDGYCQSIITPRIEKLKAQLPHLLKK